MFRCIKAKRLFLFPFRTNPALFQKRIFLMYLNGFIVLTNPVTLTEATDSDLPL